jgi:type I restriction enzyme S subunit
MPTDFEEIKKLAQILKAANKEIEILQKELYQEKQKKKALMQLLLTGIVRV